MSNKPLENEHEKGETTTDGNIVSQVIVSFNLNICHVNLNKSFRNSVMFTKLNMDVCNLCICNART